MARTHARLLASIWSNPDFIALDCQAQRLYMLALSQPTVSYCGVVPYTARRWASFAADTLPRDIDAAARRLAEARFVVLDEDTEELMIRSFVRHDGVLKSPNITIAMSKDFDAITSKRLRAAFVEGFPEGFLEGLPEGVRNGLGAGFREALHNPSTKGCGTLPPDPEETPPVRASCAHGAGPLPLPLPHPSPPGGGEAVNGSGRASPGSAKTGEGNPQANGKPAPPWAGERHAERWQTFADRIVAVLGDRHRQPVEALVDRWRTILGHQFIDQAIGLCEGAEQKPRTIAYFEKTLATTAAQNDVDVPATPAGSVAR